MLAQGRRCSGSEASRKVPVLGGQQVRGGQLVAKLALEVIDAHPAAEDRAHLRRILLLLLGGHWLVEGAVTLARRMGVSALVIGMTVVAFGTSAPELALNVIAAIDGETSLAFGNVVGSNIANIGLVVGVTALVMPFTVRSQVLLREFPIMFACILLALVLCWDGYLSFADGIIFLVGLIGLLGATAWRGTNDKSNAPLVKEMELHLANGMSSVRALTWLNVGLGMLLLGSYMLVEGAGTVATHFGVSDLIIGLTIVAIGTSLPELAASVASALKGAPDIALGNVIGSNMFNILGVVSVPALLHPSPLEPAVITRDFPVMITLSIVLLAMAIGWRRNGRINRIEGFVLLLAFSAYQCWLYFTS